MKIVAISDTHNSTLNLPEGDVLIHAGDFTMKGEMDEVQQFSQWLSNMQDRFKYIIMTPGNHDYWFDGNDSDIYPRTNVFINRLVIIEGIKFWLSPYTPTFGPWAFMKPDKGLWEMWKKIPDDIDVLVTHGPPYGVLDRTIRNKNVGSKSLGIELKRIVPKIHIFGHIHEAYGEDNIGGIHFINASIVNEDYLNVNEPMIINL